jgi:phosphoglycerol transferase MdoB-like AlkP superfamily enzyme
MDDQRTARERDRSVGPLVTSTPRERILAGVLALVYLGLWTLPVYAYSTRIEDRWPARMVWVAYATWWAIMLVLPLVVVCLFFGIDRRPAWLRGRFSLRALLIVITLVAVVLGVIVWGAEFFNPAH